MVSIPENIEVISAVSAEISEAFALVAQAVAKAEEAEALLQDFMPDVPGDTLAAMMRQIKTGRIKLVEGNKLLSLSTEAGQTYIQILLS